MKDYLVKDIRNIAVLGHGSEGKTTLIESMLYAAGVTDRQGRVEDGNTVSDYDPEEVKRHISISASVVPIEIHGKKLNFIDVPGYFDFAGEMAGPLHAVEGAVIVMSAVTGISTGFEKHGTRLGSMALRVLLPSPRWIVNISIIAKCLTTCAQNMAPASFRWCCPSARARLSRA